MIFSTPLQHPTGRRDQPGPGQAESPTVSVASIRELIQLFVSA
ncbi:hypothetical protein [Mesorhizobium helmanticense]|nr:hypothetical protein [Mesorhizobium helmanticense]